LAPGGWKDETEGMLQPEHVAEFVRNEIDRSPALMTAHLRARSEAAGLEHREVGRAAIRPIPAEV
jgi:hypothetical protein